MAYTQAELSGPLQLGDDKKLFFYDGSDASDSLSTIMAAGYFNNTDDSIRMAVDDLIIVKGSSGTATLQVTAVTSGSVTTKLVSGDDPIETGTTSVSLSGFGTSILSASTGGARNYRLPAPVTAGQRKTLIVTTTTNHIITSTGGYTLGTTGGSSIQVVGVEAGLGRFVSLVAASTTQYLICGMSAPSTGIITMP